MIYDVELLLLISYLEKMQDASLPLEQREYLSIQFYSALSASREMDLNSSELPDRDRESRFNIQSVISRYLDPENNVDMHEIPVSVHRWIWEYIIQQREQRNLISNNTSTILRLYQIITDPFVRIMIIRLVLSHDMDLEILDDIFRNLLPRQDIESDDNETETISRWTEHEELIDIILSFSVDILDSQRILQILLGWIETYSTMREMFRDLLVFRLEYLVGNVGQQIRDELKINEDE